MIPDYLDLRNCDNMELMAQYPDKHFDVAIVDPPYGIGEDGGKNRRSKSKHKKGMWDRDRPCEKYFNEVKRASVNQVIWGANYFPTSLQPSMGWVCWDKKLDNSDFSDFELAYTSFNRAAKIFRYSKNGGSRTEEALADIIHPTQKPVQLYKWLLKNYAKPGDKILDTHLGSMSIAIAVHEMNKQGMNLTLVGCELDADYYREAMRRVEQHCRQQSLF